MSVLRTQLRRTTTTEIEPVEIEPLTTPRVVHLDLIALALVGALVPLVPLIPLTIVRAPLGLLLALGLPGYALTAALFPNRRDLDGLTRTALIFGLSVALLPVMTLVLSALPWGLRPWPVTISLSIWTLTMSTTAVWRRRALDLETPPSNEPHHSWPINRYLLVGGTILGVMVVAIVSSGWLVYPPARPTEFYVLNTNGMVEQYPRDIAPTDEIELMLGIVSHERGKREFTIDIQVARQPDTGAPALLASSEPISLQPGKPYEFPVTFRIPWVGANQQIDIYLRRDGETGPYRHLQLWVDVVDRP